MKKFFGNKQFYKMVLTVAIPIIIQNTISNFVNMLDNVMVGQIGTEQMTGVSVVNQLMFVFNLAIFGAVSGPGIFTAQYVGQKNSEGIRHTVRFKLMIVAILSVAGMVIFSLLNNPLISIFLTDKGEGISLADTLMYAKEYLAIMIWGLIPFGFASAYSGTLRESGETKVPMYASLVAVFTNLCLNYILIFGHFGAPCMGVRGAALATVIARYLELGIVVIWSHTHKERNEYIVGLYKGFYIPRELFWKIIKTGTPLFLNEFFWSLGMSALTQCYSTRGLEVVAAFNISNTITNLFNVVMISMGNVVAIIVGQTLGAGKLKEVVDVDRWLITLAVLATGVMAVILFITAPLFPKFYNTTEDIRELAVKLMRTAAFFTPLHAFMNAAYFTLRSGGKTIITFLFDSAFLWVISWPVAFALTRLTGITILPLYTTIMCLDLIKVAFGAVLLKKRVWIHDLVN